MRTQLSIIYYQASDNREMPPFDSARMKLHSSSRKFGYRFLPRHFSQREKKEARVGPSERAKKRSVIELARSLSLSHTHTPAHTDNTHIRVIWHRSRADSRAFLFFIITWNSDLSRCPGRGCAVNYGPSLFLIRRGPHGPGE
jgi:hypothetical protein